MQKSQRMSMRLTELEGSDWGWAAGGKGKVSEWLRALANAEVRRLREEAAGAGPITDSRGSVLPTAYATDEELRIASSPEKILVLPDAFVPADSPVAPDGAIKVDMHAGAGTKGIPQTKVTKVACSREHHHRKGVYCGACKKVI